MPSTYSPDLRIELIANGDQSGTWGSTTNTNLGTVIEDAISGLAVVTVVSANQALSAANGSVDQARNAAITLTTTTGAPFNVYVPPVTKLYVVKNVSAFAATVYCSTVLGNTTAAGSGVAIPAGASVLLRSDGVNIVEQLNYIDGPLAINGTATAPTPLTADNSTKIATTAYVTAKVAAATSGLADPGSPGIVARTANVGETVARTITAGTGISVSDGTGVSGNPTITNTGVLSVNGATGAVITGALGSVTAKPATGTTVSFASLPTGLNQITVMLNGVSFANNTNDGTIRIGSGTVASTGYDGQQVVYTTTPTISSNAITNGFASLSTTTSGSAVQGTYTLTRLENNTWICSGRIRRVGDGITVEAIGSISLAGPLNILSVVATTSVFDAGLINIFYQ